MNDSTPKVGTPDVTMETLAEAAGFSDNSVVLALGDARSPTLSALEARVRHLRFFSWTTLNPGVAGGAAHGPGHIADRRWEVRFPEPIEPASLDGAVVEGLREQVHPLSLLEQLATALKPGGVLLLSFATDDAPPRMARWREFVLAIAGRLGLAPVDNVPDSAIAKLKLSSEPRWKIGLAHEQDYLEIASLFGEIFGHNLTTRLWNWKYGNGRGNAVVARRDGKIVAHYGGMFRGIMIKGKSDWALQIGDVMVHPRERGVLTRHGPFLLTAATSAEIYGPLGFGFPNKRAMQVAERLGLYKPAGRLVKVTWRLPRVKTKETSISMREINRALTRLDRLIINSLWVALAKNLGDAVVGVRNADYIQQRYIDHPEHNYFVILGATRYLRLPLGLIVLRRIDSECEILDYVGPLKNIPRLLECAFNVIEHWGVSQAFGWFAQGYLKEWLVMEGKEEPLDIEIPTSWWTKDSRALELVDRWWLTSGDTDFR